MKTIFLLLIISKILFGQVQTVSIGKIDKKYNGLLSKKTLIRIIKEIETVFESQLGFNVFDYKKEGGKPIDILYIAPSKKKKQILQQKKKSKKLIKKINIFQISLQKKQKNIQNTQEELQKKYDILNNEIEQFNTYIEEVKVLKNLSNDEAKTINSKISNQKKNLKSRTKSLDKKKKKFNKKVSQLQNKIRRNNLLINKYNRIQRDIERLTKNYKEIKGVTKKHIKTTYTTITQYGVSVTKEAKKSDAEKIEIYSFENLNILKVVLAHELGHLVGLEHIETTGALMHPYLQEEQIKNLSLTYDDIDAFNSLN